MVTFGIDPGLNGAMAALDDNGRFMGVVDLPIIRDASLAWVDCNQLRSLYRGIVMSYDLRQSAYEVRFVIERVSAMPKQGVTGVFTFGVTFGSILAGVQSLGWPIEFVRPAVWKKALGLSGKAGAVTAAKHAALDKARLLFPQAELGLCKHEGRAEALLLAWYAQRYMGGVKEAA